MFLRKYPKKCLRYLYYSKIKTVAESETTNFCKILNIEK